MVLPGDPKTSVSGSGSWCSLSERFRLHFLLWPSLLLSLCVESRTLPEHIVGLLKTRDFPARSPPDARRMFKWLPQEVPHGERAAGCGAPATRCRCPEAVTLSLPPGATTMFAKPSP